MQWMEPVISSEKRPQKTSNRRALVIDEPTERPAADENKSRRYFLTGFFSARQILYVEST